MGEGIEDRFRAALDRRLDWLRRHALPLWAETGVDSRGGFFERIDQRGRPVVDLPRRTRLVARQTYVFATATARGWGDYRSQAAHGAEEIFGRCLLDTGLALSTYAPDGVPLRRDFDSYDQAFVLFALATIAQTQPDRRIAASSAGEHLLGVMRTRFSRPDIGFEEAAPRRLPLLQNPHMHLLEACLAFDAVSGASSIWRDQAHDLVLLADTRLIDQTTGTIHEFYDGDWRPVIDAQGGWIEPGHQFEWAWLLWHWHRRTGDQRADGMANKLYTIGSSQDCIASGHVIDAIDANLARRASTLRLWPQTERLKACLEAAERVTGAARAAALAGAIEALDSLDSYLTTPVAGLWNDRLSEDRAPVIDDAPASSLYHIVCALDHAERFALQYAPADL